MNQLAENLKALSDPTRLRIVRLLDRGELCICDLTAALELPQSRVSRHMTYLKNSGWATGRRSGKWIYYSLTEPEHPVQRQILAALQQTLPQTTQGDRDHQRLQDHLATKNTTCDETIQPE